MVVEADESDGSFLRLDGTIAVVTNIDPEHLDHYGSFDAVKEAFVEFIENVPFYGAAVLCIDHPEVQKVIAQVRDRRVITYGFSAQADWRAESVRTPIDGRQPVRRDPHRPRRQRAAGSPASRCRCPAATTSRTRSPRSRWRSRWAATTTRSAPASRSSAGCGGASPRSAKSAGATVIDDYAHHPVEIRAVLAAAREGGAGPA